MRLTVTICLLLSMATALVLAGCGGGDPRGETELQAQAQALIQGAQTELQGQFRIESDDRRLRVELDTGGLPLGQPVSFCLVTSSGSTPLSAPQLVTGKGQEFAQFQLDSGAGQTVPSVIAGNQLEAREGASSSGAVDCSAPLLLSATFQPDVDKPGGH